MCIIVYKQCVQFTPELPLKERRRAYILRALTERNSSTIRETPGESGIQIDVVPVSISAEHGETTLASHSPTSSDPNLNLRRIAMR